jgi:hypothetical protein
MYGKSWEVTGVPTSKLLDRVPRLGGAVRSKTCDEFGFESCHIESRRLGVSVEASEK